MYGTGEEGVSKVQMVCGGMSSVISAVNLVPKMLGSEDVIKTGRIITNEIIHTLCAKCTIMIE